VLKTSTIVPVFKFIEPCFMPELYLQTLIKAPLQVVYDLSRDISFHQRTMEHTGEKAIAGVTSGLINLNETVTWQATHLFKNRYLTTRITSMSPPHHFIDEMVEGDFKSMQHLHFFRESDEGTLMEDRFIFESTFGFLGQLFNLFFLTGYMRKLLEQRNRLIKEYAENGK
jgi:ligand-binding SRPBCC domain-containing protein